MIKESADKWFQRATELEAENAILREAVHKSDGMANEINILTKENRKLRKMGEHYADDETWFEIDDSWAYTGESIFSLPFVVAREALDRTKI